MKLEIIDYSPEYKDSIRILNEMWLKKYFRVEDSDVVQLGDPEGEIIEKGGFIFYAKFDDEIVGVAALMRLDDQSYELSKMAVDPKFQGNGIGRLLATHCIDFAIKIGVNELILYTNSQLKAAIHLYEEFGFVDIDLGEGHYERADRKMSLCLKQYNVAGKSC